MADVGRSVCRCVGWCGRQAGVVAIWEIVEAVIACAVSISIRALALAYRKVVSSSSRSRARSRCAVSVAIAIVEAPPAWRKMRCASFSAIANQLLAVLKHNPIQSLAFRRLYTYTACWTAPIDPS